MKPKGSSEDTNNLKVTITDFALEPYQYCQHHFFEVPRLYEDYANYTAVKCVNCGEKRMLSMREDLRWDEKEQLWVTV